MENSRIGNLEIKDEASKVEEKSDQEEVEEKKKKKCFSWKCFLPRFTIFALLFTFVIMIAVYPKKVEEVVTKYCDWMESNIWLGTLTLGCLLIVLTTLGAPGSL